VSLPFFEIVGTCEDGGGVREGPSTGAGEMSCDLSTGSGCESDCITTVVAEVAWVSGKSSG